VILVGILSYFQFMVVRERRDKSPLHLLQHGLTIWC
jgi:hypothetical protein